MIPKYHFRWDTLNVPQSVNTCLPFLPGSFKSLTCSHCHHHPGFPQIQKRTEGALIPPSRYFTRRKPEFHGRNDLPKSRRRLAVARFPPCYLDSLGAIAACPVFLLQLLCTPDKEIVCRWCLAHAVFLSRISQCGWRGGSVVKSPCFCRGLGLFQHPHDGSESSNFDFGVIWYRLLARMSSQGTYVVHIQTYTQAKHLHT